MRICCIYEVVAAILGPQIVDMKTQLSNIKLEEGETIEEYFHRNMIIFNRLSMANINYADDTELCTNLLKGLPKEYSTEKTLAQRDIQILANVDNLMALLKARENTLKQEREQEQGASVYGMSAGRGGRGGNRGRGGRGVYRGGVRKHFAPRVHTLICYNCQKPGHMARDCRSKPRGRGGRHTYNNRHQHHSHSKRDRSPDHEHEQHHNKRSAHEPHVHTVSSDHAPKSAMKPASTTRTNRSHSTAKHD